MKVRITHANSPYTLVFPIDVANLQTQTIFIDADVTDGGIIIRLPSINENNPTLNAVVVVNDVAELSATNNITVIPYGSELIDAEVNLIISTDGGVAIITPSSNINWLQQAGGGQGSGELIIPPYFMGAMVFGSIPAFDRQSGFISRLTDSGIKSFNLDLLAAMNWHHLTNNTTPPSSGQFVGILESELDAAGNIVPSLHNWAALTVTANFVDWERFKTMMLGFESTLGLNPSVFLLSNIRTQSSSPSDITKIPTDPASNQLALTEQLNMIDNAVLNGLTTEAILLGVELSDTAIRPALNIPGGTQGVDTYIARAKPIAQGIKAQYPNLKIVVAGINPLSVDPFNAEWNNGLYNSNEADHWFDEVGFYNTLDNLLNIEIACRVALYPTIDNQFDCFRIQCHSFTETLMINKINAFATAYPNYPLRILTWNLDNNGTADPLLFSALSVSNTMANALYEADVIMQVLKWNHDNDNIMTKMFFFNYAGSLFSFISQYDSSTDDNGNVVVVGTNTVQRVTMFVFRMFGEMFDGSHTITPIISLTLPVAVQSGDCSVLISQNVVTGKNDYYITNWGDQTLSNTDIVVNGSPLPATADLEEMYGSELKSSYGAKEFTGTFSLITIPVMQSGVSVVIKPYSVTHLIEL